MTRIKTLEPWWFPVLLFVCAVASTTDPAAADVNKDVAAAIDLLSKSTETQVAQVLQVFDLIRQHPKQQSLAALVAYLQDPEPTRRRAAIYAIQMLPWDDASPAFPRLHKLLTHSESLTRGMAGMALASLADVNSYGSLVKMLESDDDPYARRCAAWSLGELRNQKAMVHLETALSDTNTLVKSNAQNGIERLRFLREFQDVTGRTRSVYEGIWLISGSTIHQEDRINRALALIRSVDESVRQPILEKLKSSKSPSVRNSTLLALSRI